MEKGTVAIGEALGPDVLAGMTIATDLPASSTSRSRGIAALRLDDQALAKMEQLAAAPLPPLPPCGEGEFAELIRALTILPRRADDELTGKLRTKFYQRKLGGYPHEALQFMVSAVLDEFDWFPSIAQCKAILDRWERKDEAVQRKASAAAMARAERQARFDDVMRALELRALDQVAIDALPLRLREIGVERGFLRQNDDGVFRARPVQLAMDA